MIVTRASNDTDFILISRAETFEGAHELFVLLFKAVVFTVVRLTVEFKLVYDFTITPNFFDSTLGRRHSRGSYSSVTKIVTS